jgi:hypothetical protein
VEAIDSAESEIKSLTAIKRRIGLRIPDDQTGLALLDATVTRTKAKDLETKLHRLVIGQEEEIHEGTLKL